MRTGRILLSSIACPALQYVSILIVNVTIVEKIIYRKMCDVPNNLCSKHFSFEEELSEI